MGLKARAEADSEGSLGHQREFLLFCGVPVCHFVPKSSPKPSHEVTSTRRLLSHQAGEQGNPRTQLRCIFIECCNNNLSLFFF